MKIKLFLFFMFLYNALSYNIYSIRMGQTHTPKKINKYKLYNNVYKFQNVKNSTKTPYDSSIYLNSIDNKEIMKQKLYKILLNESHVYTNSTKKYKFNTLYFNIRKIERIFIDKKFTKIILNVRNDNEKKLYFLNESNELEQVGSLIQMIPNTISKLIISDLIDDVLGYIYHDMINRH